VHAFAFVCACVHVTFSLYFIPPGRVSACRDRLATQPQVNCIRTYDTVGVKAVDPQLLQRALAAEVVTFGSPSAVK
jgi:hypothetical protein